MSIYAYTTRYPFKHLLFCPPKDCQLQFTPKTLEGTGLARMFGLKLGHVVHILINNDP